MTAKKKEREKGFIGYIYVRPDVYSHICVCVNNYLPHLCTFNVIICGCYFLFISTHYLVHSHITSHLLGFANNICTIFDGDGDGDGIYHCGSL